MRTICIFFILFFINLSAGPAGNPANPIIIQQGIWLNNHWINLNVGYEANFVLDHRLKQNGDIVDSYCFFNNSLLGSLSIADRIQVNASMGMGETTTNYRETVEGIESIVTVDSKWSWYYSFGINAILFQIRETIFGVSGQYFNFPAKIEEFHLNDLSEKPEEGDSTFYEWQVGAFVAQHIGIIYPYMGIMYNNIQAEIKSNSLTILENGSFYQQNLDNRTNVALVLGMTISNGKFLFATIEGRVFAEEALTLIGECRF